MSAGAADSRAFKAQINAGRLPNSSDITYEGVFNENYFDIGKSEAEKLVTTEN